MDDIKSGGTTRRNVLIGGALMAASGISYARLPKPVRKRLPKGALEKMIPTQVGDYRFERSSGLVLPPPDALSDRLYDDILTRVYSSPTAPAVMMLIAYSNVQDGMLQVHRPETCYPVGGYKLSNTQIVDVAIPDSKPVPTRLFFAESAGRSEQVMYWTRIGKFLPTRWIDQRWAVVDANLRGEIPDGLLIRFSVPTTDTELGMATLKAFVSKLVTTVDPATRKLLVGA